MDSDTIWHHVDTQRAALCDILESLTDEQWRHPSLCDGWTVRDVAAHVTFAQARVRQMLWPAVRAGFRTNRMIHDVAVGSPLGRDEIIATIRGFLGSRRHVAIVSEREPLLDILIHTQDICIPLGIDHPMPADAAVTSIERVLHLNRVPTTRLRRPLRGVRLVATDVDWSHGTGDRIEGEIRWLLLLAAGRDVARRHLSGSVARA